MSTSGTEGPGEEKPSLAERIMTPDGDESGSDPRGTTENRPGKTFGRLRRHERTPRTDDTGATAGGATAASRHDRDETNDNTTDNTADDFGDDTRDDGRNNSGDDVRDTNDHAGGDGTSGGYDRDDETVVQPAVADRDDTPGGYDRPRDEADLESTQSMPAYQDDDDRSGVGPAGAGLAGGAAGAAGGAAAGNKRRVTRDELYAREDRQGERDRLERARADHQAGSGPDTAVDQEPVPTDDRHRKQRKVKPPRTTDKFFGAFGLFVLRVITGVVMGVHGVQKLLNMDGTSQFFASLEFFGTPLPAAGVLAIITGAAEVLIGVSLIFGFLTRLSGLGVLIISLGALLMVQMTSLPNPFADAGTSGFDGELELILAAIGLLLLLVGGGGWGLDRLFRRKSRTDALDDEL